MQWLLRGSMLTNMRAVSAVTWAEPHGIEAVILSPNSVKMYIDYKSVVERVLLTFFKPEKLILRG